MPTTRERYHQAIRNSKTLGQAPQESAAQKAERERNERNAMLLQTLGQAAPMVGTIAGAGIGAAVGGGLPGAAIGGSIGGGVGGLAGLGLGAASTKMTEEGDRAEFERQEREKRRQNLLMMASQAQGVR